MAQPDGAPHLPAFGRCGSFVYGLGLLLHYDRRAITQHFAYALHDLSGIVAHADYGIGAHLRGVLQHKLEGLFARLQAQARSSANPQRRRKAEPEDEKSGV